MDEWFHPTHYNDAIMSVIASEITNLTIVHSTVYSRRRSKKTSKLWVTGLCEGNSPVTGEFPAQRASNAENVSIWCRHHAILIHADRRTKLIFQVPILSCTYIGPKFDAIIWTNDGLGWWRRYSSLGLNEFKASSCQHRNSHYKNETVVRPSYLYNENPNTGGTTSLYGIGTVNTRSNRWPVDSPLK